MEKFTVDFFINKFEKIPDGLWIVGEWAKGDRHCAGGHCGMGNKSTFGVPEEFNALELLLKVLPITNKKFGQAHFFTCWNVTQINDGEIKEYQQATPKERILAALRDIKAMQNSEQEAQVSDTTKAQSSEKAKDIKSNVVEKHQVTKIRYVKVSKSIEEMELVEN